MSDRRAQNKDLASLRWRARALAHSHSKFSTTRTSIPFVLSGLFCTRVQRTGNTKTGSRRHVRVHRKQRCDSPRTPVRSRSRHSTGGVGVAWAVAARIFSVTCCSAVIGAYFAAPCVHLAHGRHATTVSGAGPVKYTIESRPDAAA